MSVVSKLSSFRKRACKMSTSEARQRSILRINFTSPSTLLLFLASTITASNIFQDIAQDLGIGCSNGMYPCADDSKKWGEFLRDKRPGVILCTASDLDSHFNWTDPYHCIGAPESDPDCEKALPTDERHDPDEKALQQTCHFYNKDTHGVQWDDKRCVDTGQLEGLDGGILGAAQQVRYIRPLGAECKIYNETGCAGFESTWLEPGSGKGYADPNGFGIRSLKCTECKGMCTLGKSPADLLGPPVWTPSPVPMLLSRGEKIDRPSVEVVGVLALGVVMWVYFRV